MSMTPDEIRSLVRSLVAAEVRAAKSEGKYFEGVSDLPATHTLVELADALEKLRGLRPDPEEAIHRRSLERVLLVLTGISVGSLLAVSSWIAIDPSSQYDKDQRQSGLQAIGAITAALVGAVAGYSARK
jgi:hypothetical protein